ncbi:Ubiquitin carboxyl-terminal hydrolase isozyme L5 [Apiospora phragmitis]|uniref:Ubiquitin carboxyl-terminal hydrolase n=1 Tax=Apiospora phragmitis TaxID=2905665 RepID=A0ABR1SVZ5_9PEZI
MDEGADLVSRTKVDDATGHESENLNQTSDPGHFKDNHMAETTSQGTADNGMKAAHSEPSTTQQVMNSNTVNVSVQQQMEIEHHITISNSTVPEPLTTTSDGKKDQEDPEVVTTAAAEDWDTTTLNPTESTRSDSLSSSKPKDVNTCPEPDPMALVGDDEPIKPIRRSARARKIVNRYEDEEFHPPSSSLGGTTRTTVSTRPKRKASEMASKKMEPETLKANLAQLEHSLSAMQPGERKEFAGWVEIESEPAFFNAMLQSFGAPSFQIRELWGLDPEALAFLPRPVHGLIFLYQYNEEDEDEDMAEKREDCPEGLWFGNQTTANACATVAIMNILMNASDPGFGPELTEFKAATADLPPPHRGQMLDKNDFIRGIHNSTARRLDLLSEDLLLDNKFEEWEKEQKKVLSAKKKSTARKTSGNGNKKKPPRKRKRDIEIANHYIAYVPVAGRVWELDGLEAKPLCHGTYATPESPENGNEDNELIQPWLHIASSAIAARMEASVDAQLNYNLLAVCDAPLLAGADGDNVAEAETDQGEKRNPTPEEQEIIEIRHEAMTKMESRRLDYTPAIHAFIVKLAEMGLLRDALKD